MDPSAISRRQARRDAMVILYQHDLTGAPLDRLYNDLQEDDGHAPAPFTREEVESVISLAAELDADIDAYSRGWPAHRLAALERSILRMGTYELKQRPDIPAEAAIDEAVSLAKKYCSREAAALVNGVLGKIAEIYRAEEIGRRG